MDAAHMDTNKTTININNNNKNGDYIHNINNNSKFSHTQNDKDSFLDEEVLRSNQYIHNFIMNYNNDNKKTNLNAFRNALEIGIFRTDEVLNEKMVLLVKKLKKYKKFLSLVNSEYFELLDINEKIANSAQKFKHKCIICDAYTIKKNTKIPQ